ncbi:MAG: shikimate kinase [Thermoplasmata archaeon]
MRGVGEATAAITIVNALPTGVGAAAGIELRTRASVELGLRREGSDSLPKIRPEGSATPLVYAAVAEGMRTFAPGEFVPVEIWVSSDIPSSAGLKSSSAVVSAILLAIANAVGRRPFPEEVARKNAALGRSTGVSATGAFDDALAGLTGDAVLTDNRADRLIERFPLDPRLGVVLWIPPGSHAPAPSALERFRAGPAEALAPVRAARAGRLWEAMELNSGLVEEAMEYSYRDLRRTMQEAGAVASGVSGLGPVFAAVAPRDRVPGLLVRLRGRAGLVRSVDFSPSLAQEVFR